MDNVVTTHQIPIDMSNSIDIIRQGGQLKSDVGYDGFVKERERERACYVARESKQLTSPGCDLKSNISNTKLGLTNQAFKYDVTKPSELQK